MAAPTPTNIHLPDSLPFPIKISSLIARAGETVTRGTPLCDYSFEYALPARPPSPSEGSSSKPKPRQKETRYGRWESPIDGQFHEWSLKRGDTVASFDQARRQPAAVLLEDCPHSTQIHGLCALCGKDMTGVDYLGSNASRATIRMTHDADGPTVSMSEAMRYDQELSQRLLDARKLSLIVDLDQTILHATVDPTVGEWMEEATRFEEKRKAKLHPEAEAKVDGEDSKDPAEVPTEKEAEGEEDEENPNWAALSDVKRFKLAGDGRTIGMGQDDGSWYYIKPRPGLVDFLDKLKHKYEMHVYTMGTRAYALEVCKALDPDQSIFGNRILTRDESGSMTSKNLQRLFPSDQSMVAIIDDRSDVWADVPNLVKVNPYDFFVGIGDINSAHLPANPSPISAPLPISIPAVPTAVPSDPLPSDVIARSDISQPSPVDDANADAEAGIKSAQDEILTKAQALIVEHVVHDRPLAKMQEQLDSEAGTDDEDDEDQKKAVEGPTAAAATDGEASPDGAPVETPGEESTTNGHVPAETAHPHTPANETAHKHRKVKHKMLLHNNDHELVRVEEVLNLVHEQFYSAYDARPSGSRTKPDIRQFISARKAQTFAGLHFTFSNVFPTNQDPRSQPIWRQAEIFGAKCYPRWNESITHVIAVKLRSEKTDRGERKPGVAVLHPQWLWECVGHWRRIPEQPYIDMLKLLDAAEGQSGNNSSSHPTPPAPSSSSLPPSSVPGTSSNGVPIINISEAPGEDEETEELEALGSGSGAVVDESVDWGAVDEEVDAFLNETDDDDEDMASDMGDGNDASGSGYVSDSSVKSGTSSNGRVLKRRRSGSTSSEEPPKYQKGLTGSPLTKRLKLSRDRQGQSGLKVEVLPKSSSSVSLSMASSPGSSVNGDADADDDDEDGSDNEEDEDEARADDEEMDEMEENMRDATDDEEGNSDDEDDDDDFLARDIEFG